MPGGPQTVGHLGHLSPRWLYGHPGRVAGGRGWRENKRECVGFTSGPREPRGKDLRSLCKAGTFVFPTRPSLTTPLLFLDEMLEVRGDCALFRRMAEKGLGRPHPIPQ